MIAARDRLPAGKRAAICLTVDDVHPSPIATASLAHLKELQRRHPALRATLFTTPDWRSLDPYPGAMLRARVPFLRDRIYTVPIDRRPTYRIDLHPEFCAMLRAWPGIEIAYHGLHHVRTGLRPIVEFRGRSRASSRRVLRRATGLFGDAGLSAARGICPPGWEAPPALIDALRDEAFEFLCSARDLDTPVAGDALTAGSGLRGMPLIHPAILPGGLVHISTNFQATSSIERALEIVSAGGVLAIKCHAPGGSGAHRMLDELNARYCDYLDQVLSAATAALGDALWWATAGEVARQMRG